MSEVCERCYICKWWDEENQIDVGLPPEAIKQLHCIEQAAKCKYIYPPRTYTQYRDDNVYKFATGYCSGFRLREKKLVCEICNETADRLFDYDSLDDELEICEKCLEEKTKK